MRRWIDTHLLHSREGLNQSLPTRVSSRAFKGPYSWILLLVVHPSIHTLSLQLNPKINPFGVLSSGESLGEIPSTHFRTSFGSVLYLCNTIHKLTSCSPSQQSNRVPVSCVIQSYAPLHWSIVNTGHWTSDRRIDNNGDNRSEGLYVAMNRV